MSVKGYKLPSISRISSGESNVRQGAIVNTVLYARNLLGAYILHVLTTKKKGFLYKEIEVFANSVVVINFKYISVSDHHSLHLKFIQCFMSNYISI